MNVLVHQISSTEEIQKCLAIRNSVFVVGQNVPIHEEMDGKDKECEHYLAMLDGDPTGTARVRFLDDYAKIERVAILDAYQGKGIGRCIMKQILSDLANNTTIKKARLSSQCYAIPFYEKLGFQVCSETYIDAGILHQDMVLAFH